MVKEDTQEFGIIPRSQVLLKYLRFPPLKITYKCARMDEKFKNQNICREKTDRTLVQVKNSYI